MASRRRAWPLQVFRKGVQLASLAFVVYAPLSMYWRNYKVSHNASRLVGLLEGKGWAALYRWNEWILSRFGEPLQVSDGFLGAPWGATVGGLRFTDPWSALTLLVQGQAPPGAMLLGALLPLLLALVAGKAFCSFLCPARLLFELAGAARQGLLRLGLPLPEWRLPRIGLWVGLGALLASVSAGAGVFAFVLPYLSLASAVQLGVLGGVASATGALFAGMLLVDALVAPGQICHSLCPTGALLERVGARPALRLARAAEPCPPSCAVCQRVCPYGLFPGARTHRPACDGCGRCVGACPAGRLSHRLSPPGGRA